MTDKESNNMLDVIAENDQLCIVCKYYIDCHGLTQGPNGPIYPPCADKGTGFDSGLFDEEDIVDWYKDIVNGNEGDQGPRGMPGICPSCEGVNLSWNSQTDVSVCQDCGWTNEGDD